MRWFVVAPRFDGISSAAELSAIAAYHEVAPEVRLDDYVIFEDVVSEVSHTDPCDVLALLSHADVDGVRLSEDQRLGAYDIARIAKSLNVGLVYLSTCGSALFVEQLVKILRAQDCDLIYYDGQLADIEAVTMTVLFSAALAESGDFFTAYERVTPTGGNYHYRSANRGSHDRAATSISTVHVEIDYLRSELRQLTLAFVALLLVVIVMGAMIYQQSETLKTQIFDIRLLVSDLRSHVDWLERGKP